MSRHGFHTFPEPRSYWDTPLADRPDWDEIERIASELRNTLTYEEVAKDPMLIQRRVR